MFDNRMMNLSRVLPLNNHKSRAVAAPPAQWRKPCIQHHHHRSASRYKHWQLGIRSAGEGERDDPRRTGGGSEGEHEDKPLFKYLRILNPVIHYMTATEHIRSQPNRHKFELLPILAGQTFARLTPNWKIIKCWQWRWQLQQIQRHTTRQRTTTGIESEANPGKPNWAEGCPKRQTFTVNHPPTSLKIHNYYPAATVPRRE